MGVIKFFCNCGREIWENVSKSETFNNDTLGELKLQLICSDCLMTTIQHEREIHGQTNSR